MRLGRTAIVVAGMHRSGTSATTRILNLLGAELCRDLIPAGIGNERGHWESSAVQALHNRLLAELGSDIYSPVNVPAAWFGSAAARAWIDRMRELLAREYPDARLFVVKDPRIALFLPLWSQAMREEAIDASFVLPFRQPDAVARSLEARERRLESGNALPQAQGIAVWLRYVLAAEKHSRGQPRAFVAFDRLLADWRAEFARIGQQLGIAWPRWQQAGAEIDAFLDRDRATGAVREERSNTTGFGGVCRAVHSGLQRAVLQPNGDADVFDDAAEMAASAENLFAPYVLARERATAELRARLDADSRSFHAERADLHRRFAHEIGLRDARIADAAAHAQALSQDRDRAAKYARALEQSRDEAVEYAQSLERAHHVAMGEGLPAPARQATPVFFTIAARNYLAYAITALQSIAQHHPDAACYLILADRDDGDATLAAAAFTTVPAQALGLPDFDAFAFRYTVMEFATAIKPYAFAHIRRLHPDAGVVYLDPDILVLAPLERVQTALAQGSLAVLTPHLLGPIDDDRRPGEREILASGTYNCGFIAIGAHAQADRLIAWWADRLEFGAFSDIAAGLFTDQKWIDLIPGLFADVRILRDDGYNLAYWNLSQRPVSRRGETWYAGERPLVFVHFSGVDPDRPEQFSKHQDRHTQATIGGLAPLYEQYLQRLSTNGYAEHRAKPYAFGRFDDGEPICDAVRAVYRRYFDKGAAQPQARPFAMDRTLYDVPCDELPVRGDAPVTRLMYAVWKMRADLRRAFDIGEAQGRAGFIDWFAGTAGPEMGIPSRHIEPAQQALAGREPAPPTRALTSSLGRAGALGLELINWTCRFRLALGLYALIPETLRNGIRRGLERVAGKNRTGINLVGYAHGEFGVAEILRRYAYTLKGSGVPFVVRNFDVGVASRQGDRSMQRFLSDECRYDVNLFCINADQMPVAREHLGETAFAGRYNIGCWFWELEKFPTQWHGVTDMVDEIWVTSAFVRDAIAACTPKPVHIVPVSLGVHLPRRYSRGEFGLAEGAFVCLFSFDFNSFVTRKNAQGAIDAFRRAFGDARRDVRLVIKTINGERHPEALRKLVAATDGDERIEVRDGFLDRSDMWGLQACCDCYVSLHRSEGLGLGMAECMLLGKPVVATAYSGNLAFMDTDNSCLVDYLLVPVGEGEYPAWEGQHWAEPDVDHAADYLRRLADDPAYARRIGQRARAAVQQRLSPRASRAAVAQRLAEIRARKTG